MSILFWVVGFVVLALISGPVNINSIRPVYCGGFLQAILPFLPSIFGAASSLLKGKEAKYSTNQTPQQAQAYQFLLKQLMAKMRGGYKSPAQQAGQQGMNSINSIFYGPR